MILDRIEKIVSKYILSEYENYIQSNNVLIINKDKLKNIITESYDTKWNEIKKEIRNKLKEEMRDEYSNTIVEQTILDITQNKDININKTVDQIVLLQNKNYMELDIPIVNNSLNMNVGITDSFVVINSINENVFSSETINIIKEYKFLYSINNIILEEYDNNEKINKIKEEIMIGDKVKIGLYYLKN